jgi:hypothetical protein
MQTGTTKKYRVDRILFFQFEDKFKDGPKGLFNAGELKPYCPVRAPATAASPTSAGCITVDTKPKSELFQFPQKFGHIVVCRLIKSPFFTHN